MANASNNENTKTDNQTNQQNKPQVKKEPTKRTFPNKAASTTPSKPAATQKPKPANQTTKKLANPNTNKPANPNTKKLANPNTNKPASPNANKPANQTNRRPPAKTQQTKSPVKLTMLGGLDEIGKNITLFEYENDAFLIDCGMAFPDDEMLGVDIVLPDFTHVVKNRDRIKGIVLTHGHEDHIGSLPYLLKEVNLPLYGTKLTLALVESKLKEHGLVGKVKLNVVKPGDIIKFGKLSVEFVNINHSIPDAVALAIKTPLGYVVHTGDFKIDTTPIVGEIIDLGRFGTLGNEGVLCLLADSTNAERPGYTQSEKIVGESFTNLFKKAADKRILIATFSSNIHRIQQILDAAVRDNRKVAVSGRSMINVVGIATELGYLKMPAGLLVDIDTINNYPKEQMIIITTGSQGEPMSALSRMAFSEHYKVAVDQNDCIIISATPIPGNDKAIGKVINELMKLGCDVIYERMFDVHVSGHACQEELKIIHGLTKPKFFVPVHGEHKHLRKHADLAKSMGMNPENILITENGKVVEISEHEIKVTGTVPHGRVLVDGLGVGDVGGIVLRDRKILSEDGLMIVVATIDAKRGMLISGPDIVSRGFVYVRESEKLIDEAKNVAKNVIVKCLSESAFDWNSMKTKVRDDLSKMLFQKTRRRPMVLPIIMNI